MDVCIGACDTMCAMSFINRYGTSGICIAPYTDAQIFMWWKLPFNGEMKQKRMKKIDIRTNDDKQIFLEHTHAHSLTRSFAHTFCFPFCKCRWYFFCVYVHVAQQYYMYTVGVRMTNLFIFCILLVPFYFCRSLLHAHSFYFIFCLWAYFNIIIWL